MLKSVEPVSVKHHLEYIEEHAEEILKAESEDDLHDIYSRIVDEVDELRMMFGIEESYDG